MDCGNLRRENNRLTRLTFIRCVGDLDTNLLCFVNLEVLVFFCIVLYSYTVHMRGDGRYPLSNSLVRASEVVYDRRTLMQ